jgi:lipoate-protein ligase A
MTRLIGHSDFVVRHFLSFGFRYSSFVPMLRIIVDPPASGPWNMAVDEALLQTAATTGQATLRFYEWQEPTLSLGYFQSLDDRHQHPASENCPVVRRASGGGAILHDRELTYSLTIPEAGKPNSFARRLYEIGHQTLITALAEYGITAALFGDCSTVNTTTQNLAPPFLCFQRRTCFDVVIGDAKIAGSAQRRRHGAVLQHGSILLARSLFAPELPGIHELAAANITAQDLAHRWAPHFAHSLQSPLIQGNISALEREQATRLAVRRFAAARRLERR